MRAWKAGQSMVSMGNVTVTLCISQSQCHISHTHHAHALPSLPGSNRIVDGWELASHRRQEVQDSVCVWSIEWYFIHVQFLMAAKHNEILAQTTFLLTLPWFVGDADFNSSAINRVVTYLPDGNYQRMAQEALILDLPLYIRLVVLDLKSNKYIAWHQHDGLAESKMISVVPPWRLLAFESFC